ncbi:hypothetical protein PanWU01x14_278300, partial [Parasponia andersonii]
AVVLNNKAIVRVAAAKRVYIAVREGLCFMEERGINMFLVETDDINMVQPFQ